MNIILTNFSSNLDKLGTYGLIGGPVGIVSSVATMDEDDNLTESIISGGIGGVVGGATGGLISGENLYGPGIGAIIGGAVGRKLMRGKSLKDLAKDVYYESKSLRENSYEDSYGFSSSNISDHNNPNKSAQINNQVESNNKRIESLEEENTRLKEENLDIEKDSLEKEKNINISDRTKEIYGDGSENSFDRFNNDIIQNENSVKKNKDRINRNRKVISDLNKRNTKLTSSSEMSTNVKSETEQGILSDLNSMYRNPTRGE